MAGKEKPKEKKPEKKEKEYAPAEFQRYAFANVAATMAQSEKDAMYIPGAINLLEKNLDFGRDGKDLYDQYVSDKATNKLIEIYDKKYHSKLAEASVSDVYNWYKPALKGATDEQKVLIDSAFGKYSGENYSKLMGKINLLQHKLKTPEGGISQEEKESTQKELEKYTGFVVAQEVLSNYNYENLRMQAVEASKPNTFKSLEDILRKYEPEKKKEGEKKK